MFSLILQHTVSSTLAFTMHMKAIGRSDIKLKKLNIPYVYKILLHHSQTIETHNYYREMCPKVLTY